MSIAVKVAPGQRRAPHAVGLSMMEVLMPIGFDDPIAFGDLVQDVMNDRPATIRVFLDFRMGCVGCPIACFHTVDDACGEHHVDRDAFLKALREAAMQRPAAIDSGDINATLCPTSRK